MAIDPQFLQQRVQQNSSEFWIVFDRDGTIGALGPTAERKLSWSTEFLRGKILADVVHEGDRAPLESQLGHLLPHRGAVIRLELRLLHGRGSWLNIDAILSNCIGEPGIDGLLLQGEDVTRFKMAEEALRFAEEKYRGIFEHAVEGIYQISPEGRYMSANPALARIFGYESPTQLVHAVHHIGREQHASLESWTRFQREVETGEAVRDFQARVLRRDGTEIWVSHNARAVRSAQGVVLWYEGTLEDITVRRQAEEALRISEERYALAAAGSNGGLWEWDLLVDQVYWSPRWASLLGLSAEDLEPHPWVLLDRLHPRDREVVRGGIDAHVAGRTPHFEAECRVMHRDGEYRWMLLRGMVKFDDEGRACRMAGSMEEITARKKAEEQLMEGALYDALTGFPNRALFLDRIRRALVRAQKADNGQFVGVLHLDIDRFKLVNDSYGHEVGDELVRAVGAILELTLNPRDTVARLGGDEYAILMEGYQDVNVFTQTAEKVRERLLRPLTVAGIELFVTVSIGVAMSVDYAEQPQDLLRDAETAMYRAKAQGKGRHVVFNPGMHEYVVGHLEMEMDLRRAVERREFRVFYQPILDLRDGRVVGFEALVRWMHPERGLVSPAVFIPMAEETGLVVEIGRFVLEESCRQVAAWKRDKPVETEGMWVSVNLSVRQFALPDIVEQIRGVLEATGVSGETIKLEITESVILENSQAGSRKVTELKDLGIQLSIDDFGTGYSSLSYLHQYPFDTLKVDRSFVSRMGETVESTALVRTIVQLARNLGMEAVAEGIETDLQAACLRGLECRFGQGFLFSKPVPPEEAEAFLGRIVNLPTPLRD